MAKQSVIKVIQFPPGETEPLFIAARAAPRMVEGVSLKTFANWRSQKKGPPFNLVDGSPYYPWREFKNHFNRGRVQTSNEPERTLKQEDEG